MMSYDKIFDLTAEVNLNCYIIPGTCCARYIIAVHVFFSMYGAPHMSSMSVPKNPISTKMKVQFDQQSQSLGIQTIYIYYSKK